MSDGRSRGMRGEEGEEVRERWIFVMISLKMRWKAMETKR